METHIYKHHYRHGHHHHKHQTFYALLAMIFFALITLGVVMSIYYNLRGKEVTENNGTANSCLVGTVDCNDTPDTLNPSMPGYSSSRILDPSSETQSFTDSKAGYSVSVPAGMEVLQVGEMDVRIGYPDTDWSFGITASQNTTNKTLNQAVADFVEEDGSIGLPPENTADAKISNVTVDGVPAKMISNPNFADQGETYFVFIGKGKVYVIRGLMGLMPAMAEADVIQFAQGFKLID